MIRTLVCFHLIFALVLGPNVCCCAAHDLMGLWASGVAASQTHTSLQQVSSPQADEVSLRTSPRPCCQAQSRQLDPVATKPAPKISGSFHVTCCHVHDQHACHCSHQTAVLGSREQDSSRARGLGQLSVKPICSAELWLGKDVLLPRHGSTNLLSAAAVISDQPGRTWAVLLNRWNC